MKCKVVGKKEVKFTNKDTGELIHIGKINVVHKFPSDNDAVTYEGQAASEISIPVEHLKSIMINDDLLLDFDTKGKLLEIEQL